MVRITTLLVIAAVIGAAPCLTWADDEVPPYEAREFANPQPGQDGYWPADPDFSASWLGYLYVLVAAALILLPAFKTSRRTHLD